MDTAIPRRAMTPNETVQEEIGRRKLNAFPSETVACAPKINAP
jgi:hypothetical protein